VAHATATAPSAKQQAGHCAALLLLLYLCNHVECNSFSQSVWQPEASTQALGESITRRVAVYLVLLARPHRGNEKSRFTSGLTN
jgi:hypothetical protein